MLEEDSGSIPNKVRISPMKKYNAAICIGRFQPVHNGHLALFKRAAALSDNIIVIVGSADRPRSFKNPWTTDEREEMIRKSFTGFSSSLKVTVVPIRDNGYSDQIWAASVQSAVAETEIDGDIVLIGHKKDSSSFYLDMFPQWDFEEIPLIEPINATQIRTLYFQPNITNSYLTGVLPNHIFTMLTAWSKTPDWQSVLDEKNFIDVEKKKYESLKYPPTFVTVDAVVVQSGHVLLIRRLALPGRGLWALPGGYLNANSDKTLLDACIRELREETKISVPSPVLIGNVRKSRLFDDINRSERGRIITNAYKIELPSGPLPRIKGSDDAAKAKWWPINDIVPNIMMEDHYDIIQWGISE